jgi:hypothetical protein
MLIVQSTEAKVLLETINNQRESESYLKGTYCYWTLRETLKVRGETPGPQEDDESALKSARVVQRLSLHVQRLYNNKKYEMLPDILEDLISRVYLKVPSHQIRSA